MKIKNNRGGVLAACMAVLTLMLSVVFTPSAFAVQTPGFVVSDIIVHGQTRDNNAKMTFNWAFEPSNGRAPASGEGFELEIPDRLEISGSSQTTQPIVYNGKNVGECVFGSKKISCTFNDGITEFSHKTDVKGSAELMVTASNAHTDAYTQTTIPFMLNGQVVQGSIPTGIAAKRAATYTESKFRKFSTPLGERNKSVPWSITFNPTLIARENPGVYAAPNGTDNITYTFTDTLGEGYDLANLEAWSLLYNGDANNPGAATRVLANSAGKAEEGFSMQVEGAGVVRTITITGPFAADTNYSISAPSKVVGDKARPGVEYTNSVLLNGTNQVASGTRSYEISSKVTITMKNGYGAVRALKYVKGSAAGAVPEDTVFPITLAYVLPNAKTAQEFADWGADKDPSIAADSNTGTVVLNVTAGRWVNYEYLFPTGTVLTIGENSPTVAGVEFGQPTFAPQTVTIENEVISEVKITNLAERQKADFKVKKTVTPVNAAGFTAPQNVTLQYICGIETGEVQVPTNGSEVTVGQFPVGMDCKVTGETGAEVAGFDLQPDLGTAVTITKDGANLAAVTNAYTQQTGTFKVKKTVVTHQNDTDFTAPKTVNFDYSCGTATGTVAVPTDGSEVEVGAFPVGTECKVTAESGEAVAGYEVAKQLGDTVTLAQGAASVVEVTNTYTRANASFTIEKQLAAGAPAAAATKEYSFDVACTLFNQNVVQKTVKVTGAATSEAIEAPQGSQCVVTEQDAEIPGYTHTKQINGGDFTLGQQGGKVTVINSYALNVGAFKVSKTVADAHNLTAGKEFEFNYSCTHPDMTLEGPAKAGKFSISAGAEHTVNNIPAGATCEVTETAADVAGADLATTGLGAVEIVKDETKNVAVTNTYTAWMSSFDVVKELQGSAKDLPALQDKEFEVAYECTLGAYTKSGSVTVTAKTPAKVDEVRSGAKCVFTEKTAFDNPVGAVFNEANSTTTVTVTAGAKDTTTEVKLINDFSALGKVSLAKELVGTAADAAEVTAAEYEVVASWVDATGATKTETLKVKAGAPIALPELPVGTVVTLKENKPADTATVVWATPKFTADVVDALENMEDGTAVLTIPEGDYDTATAVTLTNKADVAPVDVPVKPEVKDDKNKLAATGNAGIVPLLFGAGILLVVGAGVFVAQRAAKRRS